MKALVLRELRLLLLSPSGLALLSVWTFLCGSLFLVELTAWEQAQQRALQLNDPAVLALLDFNDLLLSALNNHFVVVLLFMGPLLGARLFADGNQREWLLHAAKSSTSLVLSKLIAGAAIVAVLVALTLGLPAFLALAGQAGGDAAQRAEGNVVDVAQSLLGALTLWLAGTSFVCVAAAAAARTAVPLVAALGAFLLLTVLWLLPGAAPVVGPDLADVVVFVSPASHVEHGLRGIVDVADFVWFAALCAASAAFAVVAVDGDRR